MPVVHVVTTEVEVVETVEDVEVMEAVTSADVGSKSMDLQPVLTIGSLSKICPQKSRGRLVAFFLVTVDCAVFFSK
jgi:hypothetical protein